MRAGGSHGPFRARLAVRKPGAAHRSDNIERRRGADHLRASYDVYPKHGKSSSGTVLRVLDRLLQMGDNREYVMGCAFVTGVAVELCVLKKAEGLGERGEAYLHADVGSRRRLVREIPLQPLIFV